MVWIASNRDVEDLANDASDTLVSCDLSNNGRLSFESTSSSSLFRSSHGGSYQICSGAAATNDDFLGICS